jgi:hypothetical protein
MLKVPVLDTFEPPSMCRHRDTDHFRLRTRLSRLLLHARDCSIKATSDRRIMKGRLVRANVAVLPAVSFNRISKIDWAKCQRDVALSQYSSVAFSLYTSVSGMRYAVFRELDGSVISDVEHRDSEADG